MIVAEPYPAGLDPAHIAGVCEYATGGRHVLAVGATTGICACLPSRRDARNSAVALTRTGYAVTDAPGGHGRDVLVTGWDKGRLEARLAAMRTVLHRLDNDPVMTARAALAARTGAPPAAQGVPELMARALAGLDSWVSARCGVHASRDPAIVPSDVAAALMLRASVTLEHAIEDLMARQLRVAGHATELYGSLLQQMDPAQARDCAIRWASITFHLSPSPAQDSSPLIRPATARRGPGPASSTTTAGQPGVPPLTAPLLGPSGPDRSAGTASPPGAAPASPARRLPPVTRPPRAR